MTNIVLVSDLHVGAPGGLTTEPKNKTQEALLERYEGLIKQWATPDVLICNGDAVDGPDPKGMDLDEFDLTEQDDVAAKLLLKWKAKKLVLVSGTAYHTGATCMHEKSIAKSLRRAGHNVTFTTKLKSQINGWFRLQCRHKIGGSGVPYGRATSPKRSMTWEILNAYLKEAKGAHLSVFGHVHYWQYHTDAFGSFMTLPCWQSGGRFGDEQCDGHIDIGAVRLRVGAKETDGWAYDEKRFPVVVPSKWENL